MSAAAAERIDNMAKGIGKAIFKYADNAPREALLIELPFFPILKPISCNLTRRC
jgi:hypothetical protein